MNYWPAMAWRTEGIQVTAPVRWRSMDGVMGAFWEAESQAGARGYYLAEDPRIMVFFNDVSANIAVANKDADLAAGARPMARALYIPAGMPLWTGSAALHRFSHLNLHIHKERLLRFLAPSLGRSAALTALQRPVELHDAGAVETLGRLLVEELDSGSRPPLYAESLAGSIFAFLLDTEQADAPRATSRLTQAQMNKLTDCVNAHGNMRVTIADMAAAVGLSESWFGTVFKQTTGKTPLQWQLERRIDLAKTLLLDPGLTVAEVAARLGFADQAHLTKAFRQAAGATPAAWRRMQSSH